jgi:folate-dependent phosphoribosylglycinamide formyltransferase PurN
MKSVESDVVLLGTDCPATRAIFHRLRAAHPALRVIIEERVPPAKLIERRAARLGARVVLGQLLFQSLVQRPLGWVSRARIAEIARTHSLDFRPIPREHVIHVTSVNDEEALRAIADLSPRVVVLSGTRILARQTISAIGVTVLNMHAGITPRYRGVHGGYWALREGRADLVGTTIHVVDPGIDTGKVLEQVGFQPSAEDNFATYPYLHVAHGLPALLRQVQGALDGRLQERAPLHAESRLRSHPTLLQYFLGRAK